MTRKLWILGASVFVLTLVLNLPASVVVRLINWPPGWQPQNVSGTLWDGRMERISLIGPLSWKFQPWFGHARFEGGFQQQAWALAVDGWPWVWRAELTPGAPLVAPASGVALDGQWQGGVHVQGRGSRCTASNGAVLGQDMALLSPWMMVLGNARLTVECRESLQLLADVRREGEHWFEARVDPVAQRARISGEVQPEASVAPLLIQAGMLKAGESRFERTLGKR
jgi:general secretion pathway protein N